MANNIPITRDLIRAVRGEVSPSKFDKYSDPSDMPPSMRRAWQRAGEPGLQEQESTVRIPDGSKVGSGNVPAVDQDYMEALRDRINAAPPLTP